MTSAEDVVKVYTGMNAPENKTLMWRCVGCGELHTINVSGAGKPMWEWNNSLKVPTLKPSILKSAPGKRCHSYVTIGIVHFLNDCEHELAGKRVAMLPGGAGFTDVA